MSRCLANRIIPVGNPRIHLAEHFLSEFSALIRRTIHLPESKPNRYLPDRFKNPLLLQFNQNEAILIDVAHFPRHRLPMHNLFRKSTITIMTSATANRILTIPPKSEIYHLTGRDAECDCPDRHSDSDSEQFRYDVLIPTAFFWIFFRLQACEFLIAKGSPNHRHPI